ncbi:MAG: hypothetical protein AAGI45_06580, partial [Cyanobacteria bacterium P01_H01_bin.26]
MSKNKSSKKLNWQLCKPVVASALAIGGIFNLVGVVLAEGTAAGTQITNTATATYRDPDGTPQTSTSNTVVVEVAEIAGITVTNTGAQKYDPATQQGVAGAVQPGDQAVYTFEVTNVGNDETDISLPALANFTGPVDSVVSIVADLNDDGTFDPATETITNRTDIENVAPGASFEVRVVVQTSTSAQSDDIITVQYGDTPGDAQNQPYDSSGGSIFTDDNDATDAATVGTPFDTNGPSQTAAEAGDEAPANGEREASATGEITINEVPLQQPLVTLEKEFSAYNPGANLTSPIDDTLTYDLEFTVGNTAPTGSSAQPANLQPITISVDGTDAKHVLISDALPAGTSFVSSTPADSTWTPVYTESPTGTNPVEALWLTGAPSAVATRVGFIKDADTEITVGTTVNGFNIVVIADDVDPTQQPITIANVAQIFGSGNEDDPLTPEDESLSFPVTDESGDQTPSNYDPVTDTYSDFNPDVIDDPTTPLPEGFTPDDGYIDDPTDLITTGVSDQVTSDDPTDPENLDSGTIDPTDDNPATPDDGGGEAVVVELVAAPDSALLNGPDGAPGAVGPTSDNDDFTNKSAPFSGGNPPVVAFTNTVKNDSTEDGWVTLTPIAPDTPGDLPANTTATIVAPDGTRTLFTYDGAGTWTKNPGDPDVIVPIRADGSTDGPDEFDYGVEVDLPGVGVTDQNSYPVPILAQFDSVAGGQDTDYEAENITIDRVYTGFLELVKTAQVVRGDGPPVSGDPAPGNHIRYRVQYRNISETQTGTMQGNVLLTASDLIIVEDGTELACPSAALTFDGNGDVIGGPNNWAVDNDADTVPDTRHVLGSVNLDNLDPGSTASILFYSGPADCDPGTGLSRFSP